MVIALTVIESCDERQKKKKVFSGSIVKFNWVPLNHSVRVGWKVHIMTYLLLTFLTNRIETLQHRWKKYVDHKGDYVEKYTSFGHISWEYLCQLINFSANPHISISFWLQIKIIRNIIFFCFSKVFEKELKSQCLHQKNPNTKNPPTTSNST